MGKRLGYDDLPLVQALLPLMFGALLQGFPEADVAWAADRALHLAVRQLDPSRIPAAKQPPRLRVRVLGLDEEEEWEVRSEE